MMQIRIKQLVAGHLKDSRPGVQKYLGTETDNAINELVDLLVPEFQTVADEAAAKAVQEKLADVDTSPQALVQRLLLVRANRPDPIIRKRIRKPKKAVAIDHAKPVEVNDLTNGGYEHS